MLVTEPFQEGFRRRSIYYLQSPAALESTFEASGRGEIRPVYQGAALQWAVDEDMRIIHLSLGIERGEDGEDADALAARCRLAHDKGIVIVASARSPADNILPASLDSVIGVCRNDDCDEESLIYYPESPIEFGAHGMPRPLPGVPTEMNYSGHSFAAAHATARVARLLEENPGATTGWVRKELIRSAGTALEA